MEALDECQIKSQFPGFGYGPEELSAFHLSLNSFVMSLKTGEIVCFVPEDTDSFLQWLISNGVKDIR